MRPLALTCFSQLCFFWGKTVGEFTDHQTSSLKRKSRKGIPTHTVHHLFIFYSFFEALSEKGMSTSKLLAMFDQRIQDMTALVQCRVWMLERTTAQTGLTSAATSAILLALRTKLMLPACPVMTPTNRVYFVDEHFF